jgi:hypothetical protein
MQHDYRGSLAARAEMDCHAVRFEVSRLKSSRKRFDHAKKSNHAKKHSRQEDDAIGIPIAPQNLVIESAAPPWFVVQTAMPAFGPSRQIWRWNVMSAFGVFRTSREASTKRIGSE